MNERVREFMQKAGTDSSGKWMSIDNAEKFAELIVRDIHAYVDARDTAQILGRGILKRYGLTE